MQTHSRVKGSSFYSIGLSYKKADMLTRGKFSVSDHSKKEILKQAKNEGVDSLLIMSTCNRTELYGFFVFKFSSVPLF